MYSPETEDQLIIVNRSKEYRVDKQKLRKIPYFEKMLSHDLKESKENKVILDFDEKALKSFINWVEIGCIFVEMDYVINLFNMADYFGISNCSMDDFVTYFHDNFTIVDLPVVIPQVTSISKFINSGSLNAFICRHFSKIANTTAWCHYPMETIAYICKLNLMISSEYQVFVAIIGWINFKSDSRKCYLKELLNLVRWCNFEDKDLSKIKENELFKSSDFEPESCSQEKSRCNCKIDRTKQGYSVVIEELSDKNLRVKLLDGDFMPLINQVFQSDESMLLHLLHDEHVSDISFDSGRKMIRIDWKQNKYRLLDFSAYKAQFFKIHRCVFENQKSGEYFNAAIRYNPNNYGNSQYEASLLEANEKLILVRNGHYLFECWDAPSISIVDSRFHVNSNTYMATVLDRNIYTLTRENEFIKFNIDHKLELKRIQLYDKLKFDNLFLTSKQTNDEKVIFIDKTTKDIHCFNISTEEWKSIGRIIDSKSVSSDGQKESNVLKTFTFGFVSIDSIQLCLKLNLNTIK